MNRVDIDRRGNLEASLFKAKAHASGTCKKIYAYWTIHFSILLFVNLVLSKKFLILENLLQLFLIFGVF
jgi:hypothetical protein